MLQRRSIRITAALGLALAAFTLGCDNNEFFPTQSAGGAGLSGGVGGGSSANFSFTDPINDRVAGEAELGAPDIVQVSGSYDDSELTLVLIFDSPVLPWSANQLNSLDGFVDFDLDEDQSTGIPAAADEFGGNAGLGAEMYLSLRDVGGTHMTLVHAGTKQFTGVPAVFEGKTVTIRIPRTDLADDVDGRFRMAVVVGHPAHSATDFAPNDGYYTVVGR